MPAPFPAPTPVRRAAAQTNDCDPLSRRLASIALGHVPSDQQAPRAYVDHAFGVVLLSPIHQDRRIIRVLDCCETVREFIRSVNEPQRSGKCKSI